MRVRTLVAVCCLSLPLLALARAGTGESAQQPKDAPPQKDILLDFAKDVVPFLKEYCTGCHGGPKPKGGLDLTKFKDADTAGQHKHIWDKVVTNLRTGEMPPAGRPKPPLEQIEKLTTWMDRTLL